MDICLGLEEWGGGQDPSHQSDTEEEDTAQLVRWVFHDTSTTTLTYCTPCGLVPHPQPFRYAYQNIERNLSRLLNVLKASSSRIHRYTSFVQSNRRVSVLGGCSVIYGLG